MQLHFLRIVPVFSRAFFMVKSGRILVFLSVLLSSGCLFLSACSGDKSVDRQQEPVATDAPASQAPVSIRQANLFLETSASMNGYLNGSTEFKSVLSNLVSQLEKTQGRGTVRNVNYYLIPQDTTLKPVGDANEFLNLLKNNKLATGTNSLIVDILTMLQSRNSPQTVNIFVSDFILSDFDITNKKIIQEQVSLIFNRYARSGTATSIFAFTSDFTGKYYPYPRGVQQYKSVERPFYVWMFGEEQAVQSLYRALKTGGFSPEEELHIGYAFNAQPNYRILNYEGKQGEFVIDRNNQAIKEAKLYRGDVLEFSLGLDLSGYPEAIASPAYLNKNLVVSGDAVEGQIVSVRPVSDVSLVKTDLNLAKTHQLTHVVDVQIEGIKSREGTITLVLNKRESPWYQSWSVDDDSDVEANTGKTFALAYLIGGVKEAYRDSRHYFEVSIPVTKK
jgi:hypothetical protein